jgi:hypothetical protein
LIFSTIIILLFKSIIGFLLYDWQASSDITPTIK